MAKIKCNRCKNLFEESAGICPKCGYVIPTKSSASKPVKTQKKKTTSTAPSMDQAAKRTVKSIGAPLDDGMSNLTSNLRSSRPKKASLDFSKSSPAVATATGVRKAAVASSTKTASVSASVLNEDTVLDEIIDDSSYKENEKSASKIQTQVATSEKQYPALRGLRRPHLDEKVEQTTVIEESVQEQETVEDGQGEATLANSTPLGLPQLQAVNIPGAPYPVTYIDQPAGENGASIKIPYLVTDKGLQPWVNVPTVVDGDTRPIIETPPETESHTLDGPDIDTPDDMPEFDFEPEFSDPSEPSFEDSAAPSFEEPLPFEESEENDAPTPAVTNDVQNQKVEEDSSPASAASDLFTAPNEDGALSEPEPASKEDSLEHRSKSKEEQMDEEDEAAFLKALKVTDKKAEKEEKKKKAKDRLFGKREDHEDKANVEDDQENNDDEEMNETVFDGYNPNSDHYYDDTTPTFQADRDHITLDFVLRIAGVVGVIVFVVIALIYMV